MRWCLSRPPLLAALATLLLPAALARADASHPIVPGFERFFTGEKADAARGGQLLLTELSCVSCHQTAVVGLERKQAPVLDSVGSRVRMGYLRKFLADPQAAKPGTTMPNLLAADPDRAATAEALTHFLASTGSPRQERLDGKVVAAGRDLYHKVGCAVCHGPRDAVGLPEKSQPAFAVPLGDIKAKYTLPGLTAFLDNPLQVRPSGRMPHVVAGKEAKDIASYLLQGLTELASGPGSTNFALVAKGKALFATLGCASCHQLAGPDRKPIASTLNAPALAALMGAGGCLEARPAKGLPSYGLSTVQRTALAAAVKTPPPLSKEPAAVIARALTTFNCYACHVRNKVGGPTDETNKFFQTTQPEMGDEGRVPPPLDGAGDKLNLDYVKQTLDRGAHDRPYMHTRMPGFGLANVGALPEALAADTLPATPSVKFTVSEAKVKAAGRFLVGGQALSCYKCHTFAGHKAEGVQGIDMTLMARRLRRDWFQAYLFNPQKVRPGTRMPSAWLTNGKSFFPDLLDGTAVAQIEAIWVYLQDGPKAQIPAGFGRQYIPLVPDKEAILYRNFIEGAGTRAIGVGYPEKINLAFDANEMRLALLWQGAFIDAARHWTDRGEGFQPPLGDNILKLSAGAPFAVLAKADTPWPTASPKEQGWRFTGYRLTPDERPTFQYALGTLKVEDFPNPTSDKEPTLRRTLKLTGPAMDHLYFRAAVGSKVEAGKDGWYHIDSWKMKLEGGTPMVRQSGGKSELLLPVVFTDGKAQIVQEFVW